MSPSYLAPRYTPFGRVNEKEKANKWKPKFLEKESGVQQRAT